MLPIQNAFRTIDWAKVKNDFESFIFIDSDAAEFAISLCDREPDKLEIKKKGAAQATIAGQVEFEKLSLSYKNRKPQNIVLDVVGQPESCTVVRKGSASTIAFTLTGIIFLKFLFSQQVFSKFNFDD